MDQSKERAEDFWYLQANALNLLNNIDIQAALGEKYDRIVDLMLHAYPVVVEENRLVLPASELEADNVGVLLLKKGEKLSKLNLGEYFVKLPHSQKSKITSSASIMGLAEVFYQNAIEHTLQMYNQIDDDLGKSLGCVIYKTGPNPIKEASCIRTRRLTIFDETFLSYSNREKAMVLGHEMDHADLLTTTVEHNPSFYTYDNGIKRKVFSERSAYNTSYAIAEAFGIFRRLPSPEKVVRRYSKDPGRLPRGVENLPDVYLNAYVSQVIGQMLGHPAREPSEQEIMLYKREGLVF